ncbi:MAG TPA: methyl-accepting chemotaxis protein [Aquabacterium sp.]|nr:methyl-accepting chemotaxis protein [Aquabacterium sp.]
MSLIALIPLYALFEDLRVEWFFNADEQQGVAPTQALQATIVQVQRHRGLSGPWLAGQTDNGPQRQEAATKAQANWDGFQKQWAHTGLEAGLNGRSAELLQRFQALQAEVAQRNISAEDSFKRHMQLIDDMLGVGFDVGAASNLLYDPDPMTYLLIIGGFQEGPRIGELAARMRGLGTVYLSSAATFAHDAQLAQESHGRLLERIAHLENHLKAAARYRPELDKTLVQPALAKLNALRKFSQDTLTLLKGDTEGELSRMSPQAYFDYATPFIDGQSEITRMVTQEVEQSLAHRQFKLRVKVVILALVVAGLLGFGLWLMTTLIRGILQPVHRMEALAKALAQGDLTQNCATDQHDEIGECMNALETARTSWVRMLSDLRRSIDQVSTASAQIASGSEDLSARTVAAASSLEETSSAIHQLTSTVEQTADSAQQANQQASLASQTASQGQTVMAQAVQNMDNISTASQRIADIIGVIDGIAFQTNILALNAAVEAARAGEAGKGFAVVASEVRSLAQRSAQSAREIKSLINDSLSKVETGTQLVHQAGDSMKAIMDNTEEVSAIIRMISEATREQTVGFTHVNQATQHLDSMTTQNAALVEQSSLAAGNLRDEAARLTELIALFKFEAQSLMQSEVVARRPGLPVAPSTAALPARTTPRLAH